MIVPGTGVQPLMYGYMRAPDDVPDGELTEAVEGMKRFAEAEGFCYATTFFECVSGMQSAFTELIQELKRAEARHVVVPTLDHLSGHRILRDNMVERLELDANAHVLTPGHT
ncbi:hypothetical protein [Streptomyces sp. NPDC059631]|uniref:hypothetical protein n=1 Tax=unclassified Streptomyces TaxID=2593676 RepID=UPI0036CE060D